MQRVFAIIYPLDWIVVFLVVVAGLWRIVRGPSTLDRMLGLDALTVAVAALIAVESMRAGTADYMELILVVTALGFFTTVAFYYYLSQTTSAGACDQNLDEAAQPVRASGAQKEHV
jgi:multicomponent Na+:H+ antiporter subunit F